MLSKVSRFHTFIHHFIHQSHMKNVTKLFRHKPKIKSGISDEMFNEINVNSVNVSDLNNKRGDLCKKLHWIEIFWTFDCALEHLTAYVKNALEHLLIAVVVYAALCLILYKLYNKGHNLRYERSFENTKRVLFVIAHPDDECMFFGPTIYKLTSTVLQTQTYLLCMSNGNEQGKGVVRTKELWDSCRVLGIPESNIFMYNCTLLPDNPRIRWNASILAKIILNYVESLNIDTVVTFDKHGVSQHNNHCSIYYAIAYLSMEKRLPASCTVYTLDSINLLRKYCLFFDMPLSFILSTHRYIVQWKQRRVIIKAMQQHRSQFVWFRRLYVRFSRYLIINTYQQLDMIDLELDLTIDD